MSTPTLPEGFLARAKQRYDSSYSTSPMSSFSAHSSIHFATASEGSNALYLKLDGGANVLLFLPKVQAGIAAELAHAINSVLAKYELPEAPEPSLGEDIDDEIPF